MRVLQGKNLYQEFKTLISELNLLHGRWSTKLRGIIINWQSAHAFISSSSMISLAGYLPNGQKKKVEQKKHGFRLQLAVTMKPNLDGHWCNRLPKSKSLFFPSLSFRHPDLWVITLHGGERDRERDEDDLTECFSWPGDVWAWVQQFEIEVTSIWQWLSWH